MKQADNNKIPHRTKHKEIPPDMWEKLIDGTVWELDETDMARTGFPTLQSLRQAIWYRMMKAGYCKAVCSVRTDRVFVQAKR